MSYQIYAFTGCCGAAIFYVYEPAAKKIEDRPKFHYGNDSAEIVYFKNHEIEASWVREMGRRGFRLHDTGNFWYRSAYRNFPENSIRRVTEKKIDKAKENRLFQAIIKSLKTFNFSNSYYETKWGSVRWAENPLNGKLPPCSVIYNFKESLVTQEVWNDRTLSYIPYDQWIDECESEATEPDIFIDLAVGQIGLHDRLVQSKGYVPILHYINRGHSSRNVLYHKVNPKHANAQS